MQSITLTRPDDWHVHLRDGEALQHTVADMSRYFGRAIVMPNLSPPIRNVTDARGYRERIAQHLARCPRAFEPLMVLYLTDETTPALIREAAQSDIVYAAKLYPAGATTNSADGVTDPAALTSVLEAMEKHGLPLLVHGEVTTPEVDIFDREARFIETHLQRIVRDHPELRVVLEHITTEAAVDFVEAAPANVAATITAHHLLYNRNDLLAGGIRPHYYCLPILKRARHQAALIAAATSGNPKYFLGTDSAPHARHKKEAACGCAGCYTAHAAIELYAEAFERTGALDRLEGFAAHHGADFYGLPRNADRITLVREDWSVPETLPLGADHLRPLRGGETVHWRVTETA